MNARERILAVLNREPVDRLPVDLWHTPEVGEMLRHYCGVNDDLAIYRALNLDKIVWVFMDYQTTRPNGLERRAVPAQNGRRPHDVGRAAEADSGRDAHYAEFESAPLSGYDTAKSSTIIRRGRCGAIRLRNRRVTGAESGAGLCRHRAVGFVFRNLLPTARYRAVVDGPGGMPGARRRDPGPRGVDTDGDRCGGSLRAPKWLDLVFISDDIAGQRSLLMSPTMWKRHLQPRLKRWCGDDSFPWIEGLLSHGRRGAPVAGPDSGLRRRRSQPIQHACPGMDMAELKREFGNRVTFHGGVDNQFALPRGTPDDVRREVRNCLDTLGADGRGYICCSCHNVQAGHAARKHPCDD